FFFSSRRRHTRWPRDWSSDVCSSDPQLDERVALRLAQEEGFTLIELTMVLLILGILLTIAVPSYLSFKDRASKTAARTEVSSAVDRKSVVEGKRGGICRAE